MSTKKIREALSEGTSCVCWSNGLPENTCSGCIRKLDALAEVEAIERAATALDGATIREAWHGDAWFANGEELTALDAAADTMATIAKDAPKP